MPGLPNAKDHNRMLSNLQNDEFAIYNANQHCVRYLVEYSMSGETMTAQDLVAEVNLGVEKSDEIPEKIGTS